MAQPPVIDEEIQLRKRARRRLVGAIVLVLVVVAILPSVLDRDLKPLGKNVETQIPAIDAVADKFPADAPPPTPAPAEAPVPVITEPEALPVPGATSQSSSPAVEAPSTTVPTVTEPRAVPAVKPAETLGKPAEPAPSKSPEPARKVEPAPRKDEKRELVATKPAAANKYAIQLGAFAESGNAQQLLQKVRAAGVPAYIETAKSASGTKTRVHAGPFATEEAAARGRDKLIAAKLASSAVKVTRRGD
ncbi:MAG: SPOR domain-containing protein [Burkholderiales bacterium]|nr:SPOR domain-containing protein [Burkholderiales bacterium]